MKLHSLELTGFGPFRETQRVDFDAFDRDGVFLISGRTGTGKSSILDGVSFALYGTVPRYEGGEKRLRSDHSFVTDPTEVRLEFTVDGRRWRVTRAPEYDRPAKRGGGLTTETARAELEERVDGAWVGRAAKPRDVGLLLGEILGLGAQQFQQVILLAQNKFSRFLLAPGDERQTLLRTLFGTRRFEQYRDELEQRRRDAQKGLEAATERARTLLSVAEDLVVARSLTGATADGEPERIPADDLAARRTALAAARRRAEYRVEQASTVRAQADAAHAAASTALAAVRERVERAGERALLRERLDALEALSGAIAEKRTRLELARAAQVLSAPLESADRAAAALTRAEADREAAWARWRDAGGEASVDIALRIDELTAHLARWAEGAAREREGADLQGQIAHEAAAIDEIDALLESISVQLAELPGRSAAIDEEIAQARQRAARGDDAHRRRDELTAQLAAARDAERLEDDSAAAERAHLEASSLASHASDAVTSLLQRRLAGHAGELAAALVDGQPCAVCGSLVHPQPADPARDSVTDDDLVAAEQARDAAQHAAAAAASAARAARDALAAARAGAAGRTAGELVPLLAAAQADADAAGDAEQTLEALQSARSALDAERERAEGERSTLDTQRAARRETHAALLDRAARDAAGIAEARGEFGSVAARIAAGEAERSRARALLSADAARAESARAHAAARLDLDARLTTTAFPSAEEARAAALAPADLTALESELADHAASLASTRERLLELELAAVGDEQEPADLDAAAGIVEAADQARTAAIAEEREAEVTARRLDDLVEQAETAYAGVAELAADAASVIRLADTVAGRAPNTMKMDLETFVLAAELEEIVAAANVRLSDMSEGRYSLHHSDARAARGRASGLGIDVLDAHTGRLRTPQSLSGGETFLASLALALGLGEVVTARAGGIRLDTLFVDEGFGSLDPETLELAMRTLDELRVGGRTVGVISHVETMKEQVPAQLLVEATPQGPSVIRQDPARP